MIVDAGRERIPLRARDAVDLAALVRRLDLVLLLAAAGLVGYGLWAISGITRFDVAGDPSYFVVRQAIAAALGAIGLAAAIARTNRSFPNSDGWNWIGPMSIHRFEPRTASANA